MPTSKPRVAVIASQERVDVWKAAAQRDGVSFNHWAGDALDSAAGTTTPPERSVRGRAAVKAAESCPRARFHRSGTFCKTCGLTPA